MRRGFEAEESDKRRGGFPASKARRGGGGGCNPMKRARRGVIMWDDSGVFRFKVCKKGRSAEPSPEIQNIGGR
jgi:hypothetical protein